MVAREGGEAYQWCTDTTPYLREPMDAFSDPAVQKVVVVKSVQSGGTEVFLNVLGYSIDQDPTDTLLVYPTEEDAKYMLSTRVRGMVEASPRLREHMEESPRDWTKISARLDRMSIYLGWANSASKLATKPVTRVLCDEVGKYKAWTGKESDPIKLAAKRLTTKGLENRKLGIFSTPTTTHDLLWREWKTTDKREYWVPCPHCGKFQILVFSLKTVRWPEDERDARRVIRRHLARLHCTHCEAGISEQERPRMVRAGVWAPEGCEVVNGRVVGDPPEDIYRGYHWNALYSPFVSVSEVAAAFMESHNGAAELMDFYNNVLGLPFEEKESVSEAAQVKALEGNYARGTVPHDVEVLVAGIDVHKVELYYIVRGWAPGPKTYLIFADIVTTWDQLKKVLLRFWPRVGEGDPLRIFQAGIDMGYRTDEVNAFIRRMGGLVEAMKGEDEIVGWTVKATRPERAGHGGKTAAAGNVLTRVNNDYFKTTLHRMITMPGEGFGEWYVHKDVSMEYCRHVTAEHRVFERLPGGNVKSAWKPKPEGGVNHFLSCELIGAAMAERLQLPWSLAVYPEPEPAPPRSPPPRRNLRDGEKKGYWSGVRKVWK